MTPQQLFEKRKNNEFFNTSYPLLPEDWVPYKQIGELDFSSCDELSFYLHIPFCQHLCPFCEYRRMLLPSSEMQRHYLQGVHADIHDFIQKHPSFTLMGWDIGGGTPTALDDGNFSYLMDIYQESVDALPIVEDFEPSIEGTFQTMTAYKLSRIKEAHLRRVSMGVQSTVAHVQRSNGRVNPLLDVMADKISEIHAMGIDKVNLDLMYGLKYQTIEDIQQDLLNITQLSPEQITLYELRTNQTGQKINADKSELFHFYDTLYDGLIAHGYKGRYGQNTFTKDHSDLGLSSYLRYRMLQGLPYKGFGLSAQSSSYSGVSYNCGKQGDTIDGILKFDRYPVEDNYVLPPRERLSKYIAISGYFGGFSISVANAILHGDFKSEFEQELDFCLSEHLLTFEGDELRITRKGFKHYGAVFSLFYKSKAELLQ